MDTKDSDANSAYSMYEMILTLNPTKFQPVQVYNKRLEDTHNKIDLKYIDSSQIFKIDDMNNDIKGKKTGGGNPSFSGDIIVIC